MLNDRAEYAVYPELLYTPQPKVSMWLYPPGVAGLYTAGSPLPLSVNMYSTSTNVCHELLYTLFWRNCCIVPNGSDYTPNPKKNEF